MTLLGAGAMPAAGIVNPTIDVAGAFQQGRQDAAVNTSNDISNEVHAMEQLASGAAYAMPQGPNGPVDPAKWNEVLDSFEQTGMDPAKVAKLREHPEVAAVALKGSATALQAQADAAMFKQKQALLDAQIAQAVSATAKNNAPAMGTDDEREYDRAVAQGFKGSFIDFKKALQAPGTVVNVNPDGTSGGASTAQFQKDLGGIMAKDYDALRQDAKAARTGLATLGMMEEALNDPSFYSGFGSEQLLAVKRMGAALGIDPEGVSSMETFNALNKQAALASMGGSLGTGFSNADRDFVTGQVPTLENTPEGNRKLIEIQKKIAERKIDVAKLATAYVKKNGVLDAGFEDELQQFAEANPLFEEDAAGGDTPGADEPPPVPAVGTVETDPEGGKWKFKGGDPSVQSNWERAN